MTKPIINITDAVSQLQTHRGATHNVGDKRIFADSVDFVHAKSERGTSFLDWKY